MKKASRRWTLAGFLGELNGGLSKTSLWTFSVQFHLKNDEDSPRTGIPITLLAG